MRKILLIVALALSSVAPVAAGDLLQWGVYGGAETGLAYFDLTPLNDYLDDARVDDFSSFLPLVGFNLQALLAERIHVGWEGGMFMAYRSGGLVDAHLAGASTDFFFGYDLIAKPAWRLRPELGIGGALLMLRLDGAVQSLPAVELPAATDNLDLAKTSVLGKAGLTIEWTPKLYQNANGRLGMAASLSAGLYAPLSDEGWEITSQIDDRQRDLDGDGPEISYLAGYVSLGVRFGGGITDIDN
ncbi:MAG: hypothetical protein GX444_07905 [Myxococcales bacterium]|nr:hypothetical protein [Myxococcales bacterium]